MVEIKGKKLIIYGAGWNSEKVFFYLAQNNLEKNIEYVVDKNVKGYFHGIPILNSIEQIEVESMKKCLIIVASVWRVYEEIKQILIAKRLQEFEDFVWSGLIGKKIVVTNMNCYKRIIEDCLKLSPSFNRDYTIYPLLPVHLNKSGEICEGLLKSADLLLSQDIKKNNKLGYQLSYEYISNHISSSCKVLMLPNLVGFGEMFFPMMQENAWGYNMDKSSGVFLFNKDMVLEEAWENCASKSIIAIRDYINSYIFDKDMIKQLFEKNIESIQDRERNWSIKVSDFILNNYKKARMFNDYVHPSVLIMRKICKDLYDLLNIVDVDLETVDDNVFWIGMDMYTYPQIAEILELEWKSDFFKSRYFEGELVGVNNYLKEYFWISKGILLED